jgi:hypothetical protein
MEQGRNYGHWGTFCYGIDYFRQFVADQRRQPCD